MFYIIFKFCFYSKFRISKNRVILHDSSSEKFAKKNFINTCEAFSLLCNSSITWMFLCYSKVNIVKELYKLTFFTISTEKPGFNSISRKIIHWSYLLFPSIPTLWSVLHLLRLLNNHTICLSLSLQILIFVHDSHRFRYLGPRKILK